MPHPDSHTLKTSTTKSSIITLLPEANLTSFLTLDAALEMLHVTWLYPLTGQLAQIRENQMIEAANALGGKTKSGKDIEFVVSTAEEISQIKDLKPGSVDLLTAAMAVSCV